MMFFFPLLTAVVHLAVSLYAIAMLLATLGLTNVLVLLLCAGAYLRPVCPDLSGYVF